MHENQAGNFLLTSEARQKIAVIQNSCALALQGELQIPLDLPARSVQVLDSPKHPPKKGLSLQEGRARLLHDLANIELQAAELFLRELQEFPEAPDGFRSELYQLCLDEARHFEMCLDGIEALGFKWGDFPVHMGLWKAVAPSDSLLDRILIVHRYLEASGLDAGEKILKRLVGTHDQRTEAIVRTICSEEVDHVAFGNRWYRRICQSEKLDPYVDFETRINVLAKKLPKRFDPIQSEIRQRAGFEKEELIVIQKVREVILQKAD